VTAFGLVYPGTLAVWIVGFIVAVKPGKISFGGINKITIYLAAE
jgi:hypothetical protein